jgi:hypothetical protein
VASEENLIIGAKAERTICSPIAPPTLPHITVLAKPLCKNSMKRSTYLLVLGLRIASRAFSSLLASKIASLVQTPSAEKCLSKEFSSLIIGVNSCNFLMVFLEK